MLAQLTLLLVERLVAVVDAKRGAPLIGADIDVLTLGQRVHVRIDLLRVGLVRVQRVERAHGHLLCLLPHDERQPAPLRRDVFVHDSEGLSGHGDCHGQGRIDTVTKRRDRRHPVSMLLVTAHGAAQAAAADAHEPHPCAKCIGPKLLDPEQHDKLMGPALLIHEQSAEAFLTGGCGRDAGLQAVLKEENVQCLARQQHVRLLLVKQEWKQPELELTWSQPSKQRRGQCCGSSRYQEQQHFLEYTQSSAINRKASANPFCEYWWRLG